MFRTFISSTLVVFSLEITATAATAKGPPPELFEKLDTNGGQQISMEEFKPTEPTALHPRMLQGFDSFDPKKTGMISYEDAAKVIVEVRSGMPKTTPTLSGKFQPVALDVNPRIGRAFVKVTIKGQTGTFLFDTGTSDAIIHPDFAKRVGRLMECWVATSSSRSPLRWTMPTRS